MSSSSSLCRYCSDHDVTARLMYDLSPNSMWNIVYELGSFWDENEELSISCSDYLNETWWRLTPSDSEEEHETGDFNGDDAAYQFAADPIVSDSMSAPRTGMTIGPMVYMVIAVIVLALMKWCTLSVKAQKKMGLTAQGEDCGVYGTI